MQTKNSSKLRSLLSTGPNRSCRAEQQTVPIRCQSKSASLCFCHLCFYLPIASCGLICTSHFQTYIYIFPLSHPLLFGLISCHLSENPSWNVSALSSFVHLLSIAIDTCPLLACLNSRIRITLLCHQLPFYDNHAFHPFPSHLHFSDMVVLSLLICSVIFSFWIFFLWFSLSLI